MKKEDFFNNSAYFFDDGNAVAEYCKGNFTEDVEHIIKVADEVCNHIFLFDLKSDMERTYNAVQYKGKIKWNEVPYGDIEFIFQLNRHSFFVCLGQAYLLTHDEKYARAYVEITEDWIENNPLCDELKNGSWRSLEVGMRGETWNKAIRYFKDSPYITEEFLDKFYTSMIEHADYLVKSHTEHFYISNWGEIQNHGLFDIAACLPKNEKTNKYLEQSLQILALEARIQVMNDGVQWEQSPMYHNEVMHCYLDVLTLAARCNITVPDSITKRVKKMAYADIAWVKPNHHYFLMGDADDTDVRDLISTAAYIFNDPVLKFGGYNKLDFDSVWNLGIHAEKEYEKMEAEQPDFTSISLSDSGNTYLRSDWSEKANLLHFHAGTIGGGHGHGDQLHIDLVVNGEDVLTDSGRYTYVNGPKRFEFKNPQAHNTVTVDNKSFILCKDSWQYSKLSEPVKQMYSSTKNCKFIQSGHLGYMNMPDGVYVNRKVINISRDIYVICDEMYTGDVHEYEEYFHFNEKGRVSHIAGDINKINYNGKNACVDFYLMSPDIKVNLQKGHISRHYNLEEENTVCRIIKNGDGFTSLITVINANSGNDFSVEKIKTKSVMKGIEYEDYKAEAVKIKADGITYVVIICHQELNSPVDLIEADKCIGYGNVIVFNKNEERIVGEVLNW